MQAHAEISPAATGKLGTAADDARAGRDWFASAKRALIAPFGVGTVDQALLGVVAAKHFFVRHFALAGKVVILDEIHSYDLYTGTLIDKLITTLEGLYEYDTGLMPRITFGPNRRIGALGAYVVTIDPEKKLFPARLEWVTVD